ncbi:MAG: hypothetical protein ACLUKN_10045 [Bacilli bacterium]
MARAWSWGRFRSSQCPGHWMGARIDSAEGAGHLENNGAWALCGATVAPSFEYSDFIKGNAFEIAKLCPEFAAEILKLK